MARIFMVTSKGRFQWQPHQMLLVVRGIWQKWQCTFGIIITGTMLGRKDDGGVDCQGHDGINCIQMVRWCQQWHQLTRITQEKVIAVWALGFVLILQDQEWMTDLTKTDLPFTSWLHHDIIHQVQPLTSPMMALTFNETEPHHPSRATSSSRAIQEVSSGISAEIHRKMIKILGSRLALSPS